MSPPADLTSLHRLRALFGMLAPGERRLVVASSAIQGLERVGVVATTVALAFAGAERGFVVSGALAAIFFVRSVLTGTLKMRVRGRALEVLVASLLADTGDVASPASDEMEPALFEGIYATEEAVGQSLPQIVGDGAACVALAAAALWLEPPKLLIAGGLAIGLGGAAAVLVRRVATRSSEQQWRALLPALDDASTAIRARLEIVSNGGARAFERGVLEKLAVWRGQSARSRAVAFLAGRAPVAGAALVVGLFFLREGGWGSVALGHAAVLASVTPAFAGLAKGALDLPRTLVRTSALAAVVARARSNGGVDDDVGSEVVLPATIAWDGVSFAYAGDAAAALDGVSVTWAPRELLGLAGQNGSGKSTFVRLLLGLHHADRGVVRVGDRPIADIRRASLREHVAYLAQRPFLPDRMSVAQAIALVAPQASPDAVRSTLERLGLWSVLVRRSSAAPLEVKLGTLSAGEKQRVAIARVLVRSSPLLLLDEPDANLDAEGIALVADVLRHEASSRMVLVVAHSRALLASVDRVVHFEGGKVVDG